MPLSAQIESDYLAAFRSKDERLVLVLRMIKAAVANRAIELKNKENIADEEVLAVIKTEIKKRLDSVDIYKQGGRPELADKESGEIEILKKYMPAQMPEEEVKIAVEKIISNLPAEDKSEFSKVMRAVMVELKGKADGGVISSLVKESTQK
ncbi:MAG: GatB/YqeY domain-containing protein [Parcubacteria group bacterium]